MLKKISLAFAALVVAIVAYAAIKPSHYEISRSVEINAPVEKIFPYLDNSKLAEQWGPWLEEDPDAKMTYSGPDSGAGSKASWTGGKKLGVGSATIIDSTANQRVGIQLEYVEPMQMKQYAEYIVEPAGSATKVTWKVSGENNFMGRLMCVFMNMDNMVGSMFERGLNKLKTVVEKS